MQGTERTPHVAGLMAAAQDEGAGVREHSGSGCPQNDTPDPLDYDDGADDGLYDDSGPDRPDYQVMGQH